MVMQVVLFIAGLVMIVVGADFFITGCSIIARRFGIPKLVIGLTIMAVGTSAPELGVNITASIQNHGDIALGNILGSNISNMLLIFPIALLFSKKIALSASSILQTIIAVSVSFVILLSAVISIDSVGSIITRIEGLILVFLVFIYWFYLYKITVVDKRELLDDESESSHILDKMSPVLLNVITLVSLGVLLFGSHLTTDNAVLIARSWGVSELTIAGIIIAIGTSLPELVTSIHAVRQRHHDLMIGNIVGSNIINTLFILGTSALIRPMVVSKEAMVYLFMNCVASLLLLIGVKYLLPGSLRRAMSLFFIITYILFLIYLRSTY